MDRYLHKNLYDEISFSWRVQTDRKRRLIRDRFNVPSTIEYLTPIHRVQLRKPRRRLASSHVVVDRVISPTKKPLNNSSSAVATRSVLKSKSSPKDLKHSSKFCQLQDDTKSKKGDTIKKKEGLLDSSFLNEHHQQKQIPPTSKSQRNCKTLTAEQKKVKKPAEKDNAPLDLFYDKKCQTISKKGNKIQLQDEFGESGILDEQTHQQYPQERDGRSIKQISFEKQGSAKKAKETNESKKTEDDDRDYLFKTLNENNFNVVRVSGAQQNCLYRCVVLGTNNNMLQEYKRESSSYNPDKLDKAASDLRQRACKFGRQELHTFTQLTSDYGLREVMRERKCNNFSEVLEQISKPHVPADIFDQLLLSNFLKIKLVIFRFDRKNSKFHFLISSQPEEKYLNRTGNHVPIVYVRHNHSPTKTNEEGDHYDLLLLKK